ncbi:MAG TPA: response regulator [Xanthobacteraceae bacterium]|nr:response regulator [Xanthobacteraceae bacterium]
MQILIVDDSEDSRELTEAALLSAGYTDVRTAASAWEAFKILDLGRTADFVPQVDIVLLDIVMPEIDGIEACARIRNDPHYVDLPIIMVTTLDDMDSLQNAFVAGATDYVTKPVNRVELIARVRAALKLKAELERRLERERELLAFMSNWGARHSTLWIDEATGLFVGEGAEAYLSAISGRQAESPISIIAVAVDRIDAFRAAQGEQAAKKLLAEVAGAVRAISAPIGTIPAAYRNGIIVLVAPEIGTAKATELGRAFCMAVSRLRLANAESITADHVTASVAVVTGQVRRSADRAQLLTHAISHVQAAAAAGGNRIAAVTL